MNRFVSPLAGIVLVAVSTLVVPDRASGVVRPYFSNGGARFVSPSDFVGTGTATHLGAYNEVGTATFSPTSNPTVLHVEASSTYTAANGDQLRAVFTGELDGVSGAISATVTYVGGTGRFAGASGSAELAGQMLPDGTLSVGVNGNIDY